MNTNKLFWKVLLIGVFSIIVMHSFSQNNYIYHKDQINNDSTVKIINTLKRDDGAGGAIIIQRNRNDSAADRWVHEYIENSKKALNTLKQTKSSGCSNLDFEDGNFTNWSGKTGTNNGYPAVMTANGIVAGRQTIVSGGTDPYASAANPIPLPAPNGGAFSVKLGNDDVNAEAEQLIYSFVVQPADTNFIYKYAVVLQEPGHPPSDQPYFDFEMLDQSGINIVPCSYQHYVAAQGLPGFFISPVDGTVLYKPWTTVGINLSPYVGQTVTIIATTADCSQGAHFGYAYLDFICPSSSLLTQNIYCENDTSAVLNAPAVDPGMQYQWSTGDTDSFITINPQTYNGSTISCFIESPTSSGLCGFWYMFPIQVAALNPDFSYTTNGLIVNFNGVSNVNTDTILSWIWDFGDGNIDSIQNPSHTYSNIGTNNVTLIVATANCGQDTVIHPVTLINTSLPPNLTNITSFELNPNIFSSSAHLTLKSKDPVLGKCRLELYSPDGNKVKEFILPVTNSIEIDYTIQRGKLAPGVYLYRIINNDSMLYDGKLVIE